MRFQNTITILLLFVASNIFAQSGLKSANKQFELRSFDLALNSYLSLAESNPENQEFALKVAECHRELNHRLDAKKWFEKAISIDENIPNTSILAYAHTLRQVGLYDKAQIWYWKYKDVDPILGEHFALSCDFAKNILQEDDRFEISVIPYNSKQSDFGVSFYNDRMILSSFRVPEDFANSKANSSHLFIENPETNELVALRSSLKTSENFGPVSVSKNGKMIAYSKNKFKDGAIGVYENQKDLSIFFAFTNQNGDFANERAFTYNSTDYSNAFPQLSYNGSALYFSSNRPGGYGGYDIYVSYFKDGDWSFPENLGEAINTQGNEITPFYVKDILYFSSDYIQGLGGFDVFSSKVVNGKWSFSNNMGKGINSPNDDYYYVTNQDNDVSYFSSNRLGGKGKDDIYMASLIPEEFEYAAETTSPTNQEDNYFIPKAVSLDDLIPMRESDLKEATREGVLVANRSEGEVIANKNSESVNNRYEENKASNNVNHSVNEAAIMGARKISLGELAITASPVYFIQLAALSHSNGDINHFRSLVKYGNLYKVYKSNSTKIRLGYYLDKSEASSVLADVKRFGFSDAFITSSQLNSSDLELVASSNEISDYEDTSFTYKNQSQYKVRLAAYTDPLWFDTGKVKGIGKIEQWTKGDWTIFVLSGFQDIEAAESARIKAMNKGFHQAELVLDNKGILEKVARN